MFGGTSIINAVVMKLFDLYRPSRTRWVLMDPQLQPQWAHVKQVAWYVWNHPFTPGLQVDVPVHASVVHWIRMETPNLAAQQLAFAAWYQSQVVGGSFFFGYERMRYLTGLAKDSLDRAVKELREEYNFLEMVKNYSHSTPQLNSKVRQYRLKRMPIQKSLDPTLYVITPETWDATLWFRLLRTLYSESELKRHYPFAWHRITKVLPLPIGSSA